MQTEIIKNPDELQVISNPNQNSSIMSNKKQLEKGFEKWKDQAKTAAYILGGQAIGSNVNNIAINRFLSKLNPTVQQIIRVAIPGVTGAAFATTKNKHLQGLALGLGVQSVLEGIKFVMPDFSAQKNYLGESSHFVFRDANGNAQRAFVNEAGEVVTNNGERLKLNPAEEKGNGNGAQKQLGDSSSYYDEEFEGEALYL